MHTCVCVRERASPWNSNRDIYIYIHIFLFVDGECSKGLTPQRMILPPQATQPPGKQKQSTYSRPIHVVHVLPHLTHHKQEQLRSQAKIRNDIVETTTRREARNSREREDSNPDLEDQGYLLYVGDKYQISKNTCSYTCPAYNRPTF